MHTILSLLASLLMIAPGGGKYTNPILFSDYSDPDVIRVGDDYWMTASSFTCFPGLQILHSTDLVDWEIVGAALPEMGPAFDVPSHGNGVWAPCIRYHDGRYWIFWGDPDKGVFQVNTTDPRGEWSKPHLVLEGKGLIDTSPLWDDDGRVYLVHAWAGSRAGFKSILNVCELDKDCTHVISDQVLVFDGKKTGDDTVEGPKFYKRDGWYYAPAMCTARMRNALFSIRATRTSMARTREGGSPMWPGMTGSSTSRTVTHGDASAICSL